MDMRRDAARLPHRHRPARRCRAVPGARAGQAEAALLGRVLRAGHPRRDDEDVRRRRSRTTSPSRATTAARCSSRAPSSSPCSAAISRWATSPRRTSPTRSRPGRSLTSGYLFRDAAHLKAFFDSELGAELKKMAEDQLGIHILGPTYFGMRQVGLKPDKKINDAGRHGRHQAAHAGRRRLAVPRHGARRQPDADGLCRGLYRPADRRDRRPGQSAAERREHEVLRGDVADRADLAPRRLRPADRLQQGRGTTCRPSSRRSSRPPPTRRST